MSTHILIIGAGPAGEAAAVAAQKIAKAKRLPDVSVTLVEKNFVGGLCLNRGCVPSKTLLEAVHRATSAEKPVDWAAIQKLKRQIIENIRGQLESKFSLLKVKRLQGTARFLSPSTVSVQTEAGAQTISFDKAIVAAGNEIFFPAPLDIYKEQLLTSDTLLEITQTPKSVLVVGGGAVGCEFACLLNAAGSAVTLVEMKESLLPGEDTAVASLLATSFESRGIVVKTSTTVKELAKGPNGWTVTFSTGERQEFEHVLACVGRLPSPKDFGFDQAGVELKNGRIAMNEFLQTTNPNIFIAGDLGTSRLAHHAAAQGEVAAANALGESKKQDDRFIPRCLYSWPEVASVGAWKYQLEEQGKPVKASRAFFKASARALAAEQAEGFVQLISDPETGKLLGAQIIGPSATELIHIVAVALKAEMTLQQLSEVVFAHPTLSEVIKEAAKK